MTAHLSDPVPLLALERAVDKACAEIDRLRCELATTQEALRQARQVLQSIAAVVDVPWVWELVAAAERAADRS